MTNTLRISLYGGPGTGKSTTAALVFGQLKQRGHNVELITEFAKDLTWEGHYGKLAYQPHVIGEQLWRERRLDGQVEATISDTSSLLGLIYGNYLHTPDTSEKLFTEWVVSDYKRSRRLDFFLTRDPTRPYNPKGRQKSQEEAEAFDGPIKNMLNLFSIDYFEQVVDKTNNEHVTNIVQIIEEELATDG